MTDKSTAFEGLLDELSSALAEMVSSMQAQHANSSEIAATLAEMLAVLESRKADTPVESLTEAIKSLREVTIQVNPTPIHIAAPVVQVIERQAPATYEMKFSYDKYDRLESARLVPVNQAADHDKENREKMFDRMWQSQPA